MWFATLSNLYKKIWFLQNLHSYAISIKTLQKNNFDQRITSINFIVNLD